MTGGWAQTPPSTPAQAVPEPSAPASPAPVQAAPAPSTPAPAPSTPVQSVPVPSAPSAPGPGASIAPSPALEAAKTQAPADKDPAPVPTPAPPPAQAPATGSAPEPARDPAKETAQERAQERAQELAKEMAKEKEAARSADPEERQIVARPVLRLKGSGSFEDGFELLTKAFARLEAEAKRLGLPIAGKPVTHFTDSTETRFEYEALLPLAAAPPMPVQPSKGMEVTASPAGRAMVFTYEGAYDDIDSAYEAFAAWLDDRKLVATGKFLEEIEVWPETSDSPAMRLKIVVFLK